MNEKTSKLVHWAPRILAILFLVFLAMFSLDVIQPGLSTGEIIRGLLMHNIPVFVLGILLIIAWKHEIVGGIAFLLAGLLYSGLMIPRAINSEAPWYHALSWILTIAGPAFLVGILFLVSGFSKKGAK